MTEDDEKLMALPERLKAQAYQHGRISRHMMLDAAARITALTAELDAIRMALAETEALELQHGAVIERLSDELDAANARADAAEAEFAMARTDADNLRIQLRAAEARVAGVYLAAAEAVSGACWRHDGNDAISIGMDHGARHQNLMDYNAVKRLAPADADAALRDAIRPLLIAERLRWWSPEYPGQQRPILAVWWPDEPETGLSGFDTEHDRDAFGAGQPGPFIRRVTGNEYPQKIGEPK